MERHFVSLLELPLLLLRLCPPPITVNALLLGVVTLEGIASARMATLDMLVPSPRVTSILCLLRSLMRSIIFIPKLGLVLLSKF